MNVRFVNKTVIFVYDQSISEEGEECVYIPQPTHERAGAVGSVLLMRI